MSLTIVSLFGSLIGIAVFVCGFFAGMALVWKFHKQLVDAERTKYERKTGDAIDEIRRSLENDRRNRALDAASQKTPGIPATPPKASNAGPFLMQPDTRPKIERVTDNAMGELITDLNKDPEA